MKLSRKFEPTTEDSKTRLRKKFTKYKLDRITRNNKERINDLELIRADLQKLDIQIYDSHTIELT